MADRSQCRTGVATAPFKFDYVGNMRKRYTLNLILVGCEFAGKTTLANEIVEWSKRTLGRYSHFHDHFTIPSTELEGDAKEEYRRASSQIKEMFQRFMMQYHMSPDFYGNVDHHLMGFHIEEAVYAPLYYGYGGEDSGSPIRSAKGQRSEMARTMEATILERAPNVILVLLHASPKVIRQRMATPEDNRTTPRDSEPRYLDRDHRRDDDPVHRKSGPVALDRRPPPGRGLSGLDTAPACSW